MIVEAAMMIDYRKTKIIEAIIEAMNKEHDSRVFLHKKISDFGAI